jgi:hypothetical protein
MRRRDLAPAQRPQREAGRRGVAPLALDGLALARGQGAEEVVEGRVAPLCQWNCVPRR